MKQVLTVFLGGLLVVATLVADERSMTEPPPESMQEGAVVADIEAAFSGLVAAAKSLDADRYLDYFDKERFTGLNEDGTVAHSLDEFAKRYSAMVPLIERYRSLEFSRVKITVLNSTTAVLVNEYTAQVLLKTGVLVEAAGAGTQLWNLIDGNWKLVSVSSSSRPLSDQ